MSYFVPKTRHITKYSNNVHKFVCYRTFLSSLMNKIPKTTYDKTGTCVSLDKSQIESNIDDDNETISVHLSIHERKKLIYNPETDVIIKNYSTALTPFDVPGIHYQNNNKNNDIPRYDDESDYINSKSSQCLGRNFCGTIEYIPEHLKELKFKFNEGDRVWGFSHSMFGHTWSNYIAINGSYLKSAPNNIPLHYGGLYPLDIFQIYNCLINSFGNEYLNVLMQSSNKNILFLGSGRKSLINTLVPYFKLFNINNITVVSSSKRHNDGLKEIGIKNIINYDEYINSQNNTENKYDIIIDSLSTSLDEVESNLVLTNNDSHYWMMQTPLSPVYSSTTALWKAWYLTYKWVNQTRSIAKDNNNTQLILNNEDKSFFVNQSKNGYYRFLNEYTSLIEDTSFPILIDKYYDLDKIQSALNYTFLNDDHILSEHIGIKINKEETEDFELLHNKENRCYPYKISDIEPYMQERTKNIIKNGDNNTNQYVISKKLSKATIMNNINNDSLNDCCTNENNIKQIKLNQNDNDYSEETLNEPQNSETIAKSVNNHA